jgi:hypothetical protein
MQSKEMAKKGAYMVAAQRLFDGGVLDKRLIPVHQTYPLQVKEFFETLVPTLNDGEDEVEADDDDDKANNKPSENKGLVKSADDEVPTYRPPSEWYFKRVSFSSVIQLLDITV